jgi:pimeloyl-ACP methyl ester carboxylesterase
MESESNKTFALVHGSWHDKWCWHLLEKELQAAGHSTVSMDLPVDDPTKDFDDYAEVIANSLEDKTNIVGVFHSRAGNYGPRAVNLLNNQSLGKVAVERMIFLASSFEPGTLHALGRPEPQEVLPPRNTDYSRKAIISRPDLGTDMTMLDPDRAKEILYHDVDDNLQQEAVEHLRPQNRPVNEPQMHVWPDVPQHYIICKDDKIVRPEWSEYAAKNWLKVKPIRISGSHSPFLSRPKYLAEVLLELAISSK